MRFTKVFFVLVFGAVLLITLMKVLFFALFVALIFGGISMARRAFLYRRFEQMQSGRYPVFDAGWSPFSENKNADFAQPLNPNWQKRSAGGSPIGRRIEVL